MTGNYFLTTPPEQMSMVEQMVYKAHLAIPEHLLEGNVNDHLQDPLIFPNEMGDEQLSKLPPFVVVTSEWDFYRRCAEQLAVKLQKHGKLLD